MEKQPFSLRQNVFTPAAPVKVMINVGCLFDILTGTFVQGVRGEQVLNGGLSYILGVVGGGNSFKSTIAHYFNLTFLARIIGSTSGTYDTEINVREDHLQNFAAHHPDMNGRDPIADGTWIITDRTIYPGGDEWYDIAKDYMEDKRKNAKSIMVKTPFFNRERTGHLEIIQPTSNQVDSLSEFATNDVIKMQDDNVLGDKGGNTIFMRQGLQKNRFLQEIVGITAGSSSYMMLVAQMGDDFNMDPHNPKAKKLSYLPENLKIKGVPEKYTYITNQCYFSYHTAPMRDQATKAPLYPRSSDDDLTGDTDLSLVSLRTLRSKSGPSGMAHQLVVSQSEGVLPSLTEFHFIKEHERYGLEGNLQNYTLVLCPDIKLSRTAVRRKIDAHPELRRATNILAEMCQMYNLWHHISKDILVEPKKLYDDIKALGYDWDFLLKNTRGWWALEGTWQELKFLSTMDLLKMRAGLYIPYWMENPPEAAVQLYNKMMTQQWSYNKGNGQATNKVKPEFMASA